MEWAFAGSSAAADKAQAPAAATDRAARVHSEPMRTCCFAVGEPPLRCWRCAICPITGGSGSRIQKSRARQRGNETVQILALFNTFRSGAQAGENINKLVVRSKDREQRRNVLESLLLKATRFHGRLHVLEGKGRSKVGPKLFCQGRCPGHVLGMRAWQAHASNVLRQVHDNERRGKRRSQARRVQSAARGGGKRRCLIGICPRQWARAEPFVTGHFPRKPWQGIASRGLHIVVCSRR